MFVNDELSLVCEQLFVALLLINLLLFVLLGSLLQVGLRNWHNLQLLFAHFLVGEELDRDDCLRFLRVFQLQQLVVLFHLLVRFERSELEVAEKLFLLVMHLGLLFLAHNVDLGAMARIRSVPFDRCRHSCLRLLASFLKQFIRLSNELLSSQRLAAHKVSLESLRAVIIIQVLLLFIIDLGLDLLDLLILQTLVLVF